MPWNIIFLALGADPGPIQIRIWSCFRFSAVLLEQSRYCGRAPALGGRFMRNPGQGVGTHLRIRGGRGKCGNSGTNGTVPSSSSLELTRCRERRIRWEMVSGTETMEWSQWDRKVEFIWVIRNFSGILGRFEYASWRLWTVLWAISNHWW